MFVMSAPSALLSVSDKTGIVDFARGLERLGFRILSTGGTARALREGGVAVTGVSDYTGHPEIMQGRVKTLHPKVHGGILGLREAHAGEAQDHGIDWIDLVAVNLYPFEATVQSGDRSIEEAVEQIDIGGPTMVRAAAKNHAHVGVVVDPGDYGRVVEALEDGGLGSDLRRELAVKAFRHTAAYDSVISSWLGNRISTQALPLESAQALRMSAPLRYGENPHQRAALYADPLPTGRSVGRIQQLQGRTLSFNNLADMDAALRAVFEIEGPGCVVLKHMNPCGAGTHPEGTEAAFALALSGDPVSAYGGIVAFNRPVDGSTVRALRKSRTFFEILAAPGFDAEARELLAPKEKLRVMELPEDWGACQPQGMDARRIQGGWLLQDWDHEGPMDWTVASSRSPGDDEDGCLRFAWRLCRAVKSNSIVLARAVDGGYALNGVGAGQMSRVDSVRLAISKATREVPGSALASDAFFPFPDGVEIALAAGVSAFIQPGGSIRDDAVLEVVNQQAATMVFTGARHFRH
jgi:phosphoribosylaminoimidazolecarboxamide formyltransferase/IMP cyclohydrolase